MKPTRREFLKVSAIIGIGSTLPLSYIGKGIALTNKDLIKQQYPNWKPQSQYGNAIEYMKGGEQFALKIIQEDIKKYVPPGYFYEIITMGGQDYGRHYSMAWYYHSSIPKKETGFLKKPRWEKNHYLLGRFMRR